MLLFGGAVVTYRASNGPRPFAGPPCQATAVGGTFRFDLEQAAHATTLAAVAKRMDLPDRAVTIALATALQESGLHNIAYGDRDSLGLFQQRPSQGWGTTEQIMSPSTSAATFYSRLVKLPAWQTMAITDAAQAVQLSAFPKAYAQWETQARVMAQAFVGQVPAGFSCQATVTTIRLSQSGMTNAMRVELGAARINTPVTEAQGWLTAGWLIGHAQEWGVSSVTFAGQRWTAKSGKWSPQSANEKIVRVNV